MQKAIAIDFDGCLCVNKYPEIGEPILHVIDEAKKQQAAGAGLILWTCRQGKKLLRPAKSGGCTLMRSMKTCLPGKSTSRTTQGKWEPTNTGMIGQ